MLKEGIRILTLGLVGAFVGSSGLGIGGMIALLVRTIEKKFQSVIFCVSSGIVITLIVVEMIPESLKSGSPMITGLGMVGGFWTAAILHALTKKVIIISPPMLSDRVIQTSLLMCVAISIHNIPAGISLGLALNQSLEIAYPLVFIMVLHAIPEGLFVSLPLILQQKTTAALLAPVAIVGSATGLGVMSGVMIPLSFTPMLSALIAMAVGIIAHVLWYDMILPAMRQSKLPLIIPAIGFGALLGTLLTIALKV